MKLSKETCANIIRVVMQGAMDTFGPDVTLADLRVLQVISRAHVRDSPLGVTDVAEALGLPLSTASRMIAQLGDFESGGKGFVTQVQHPSDRRRVLLKLTPAGEEIRNRLLDYLSNEVSPMINDG